MKCKLIDSGNPQDKYAAPKYYAKSVYADAVTMKSISREIATLSSLSPGDAYNVLENFASLSPRNMGIGFKMSLGGFSSFRASFSSEGMDDPKHFNILMIRDKKRFTSPERMSKRDWTICSSNRSELYAVRGCSSHGLHLRNTSLNRTPTGVK